MARRHHCVQHNMCLHLWCILYARHRIHVHVHISKHDDKAAQTLNCTWKYLEYMYMFIHNRADWENEPTDVNRVNWCANSESGNNLAFNLLNTTVCCHTPYASNAASSVSNTTVCSPHVLHCYNTESYAWRKYNCTTVCDRVHIQTSATQTVQYQFKLPCSPSAVNHPVTHTNTTRLKVFSSSHILVRAPCTETCCVTRTQQRQAAGEMTKAK